MSIHEKLHTWGVLAEGWRFLLGHRRRIAGFAWLPTVLLSLAYFTLSFMPGVPIADMSSPIHGKWLMPCASLFFISGMISTIPLATSTQRLALLGDKARTGFRFGSEEWMCLWACLSLVPRAIAAQFLLAVPYIFVMVLATGKSMIDINQYYQNEPIVFWAILAAMYVPYVIFLGLFLSRYLLVFPAASVGRKLKLSIAARLLRGNVVRLFGALAIIWCGSVFAFVLLPIPLSKTYHFVAVIPQVIGLPIAIAYYSVTLSIAYRKLGLDRPTGEQAGGA